MNRIFKLFSLFSLINIILPSCNPESVLRIENDENSVNIIFDKNVRLKGLKGYFESEGFLSDEVLKIRIEDNFVVCNLEVDRKYQKESNTVIGSFFEEIPEFKQGVTLWRYKPWNSWTKPILVESPSQIKDWDIQFFYWEYEDGVYGVAMPLSGNGYRTTFGQQNGMFGAKSVNYVSGRVGDKIPQMVIGFGDDPFKLFEDLYIAGLNEMGKSENLVSNKSFPDRLDYIGWCTWNSSENGRLLNEDFVIDGVKSFTDNNFPLGWVVIDDGWFNQTQRKLNSFEPDARIFPNGFKPMNDRLKNECDIKEIGIWHASNGYWNGINTDSELGERYEKQLFSWEQKPSPLSPDSVELVSYHFIEPESDSLLAFYRSWHQMLSEQGFSFLKVDNQLVTEKIAVNNYPIFSLSEKMHEALYKSADEYFDGAVINCMDMTAEAYLNFGSSAVARAVEDYFPVDHGGVGYNMERGNAAAHLVMAFYNSLYFGQMVFPDFDMFETYNPDAVFHAVARAINNGPIYVTDKPGKQNFDILRSLCYSDGKLIRASKPLVPTKDCLFQLQEAKPFKAYSMAGDVGLLGAWNLADADKVKGTLSPADVDGIAGDNFIVYEYFSKQKWEVVKNEQIELELPRMGCKLFYIIPATEDVAAIGLIDKYNAPGTIVNKSITAKRMEVTVADHGIFAAILPNIPKVVKLDETDSDFVFGDKEIIIKVPQTTARMNHDIVIEW